MAIVSVFKDGNWINSGECKMSDVERVLAELETWGFSNATAVVEEAAQLVEETVEKNVEFDRQAVVDRVAVLKAEGTSDGNAIKALRTEFGLPYVKARYFVVNIDKVSKKKSSKTDPRVLARIQELTGSVDRTTVIKTIQEEFQMNYASARYCVIKGGM